MNTRLSIAGLLLVTVGAATGCGARMAAVSHEKSAYVVRNTMLGTDMYHCSADGSKPVCKKVTEK